ncbi:hypothetical protein HDV04_001970 [Boothiomyces sp. JEL0838]|nr:hypothetical protein HDV04_001970 [Boothiomyces sp. JEL0838]
MLLLVGLVLAQSNIQQIGNNCELSGNPYAILHQPSSILCINQCSTDPNCLYYSFQNLAENCLLFNQADTKLIISGSGCGYKKDICAPVGGNAIHCTMSSNGSGGSTSTGGSSSGSGNGSGNTNTGNGNTNTGNGNTNSGNGNNGNGNPGTGSSGNQVTVSVSSTPNTRTIPIATGIPSVTTHAIVQATTLSTSVPDSTNSQSTDISSPTNTVTSNQSQQSNSNSNLIPIVLIIIATIIIIAGIAFYYRSKYNSKRNFPSNIILPKAYIKKIQEQEGTVGVQIDSAMVTSSETVQNSKSIE